MARAAVKAKQAQAAQTQATLKSSRKTRKHAGGGNPNQDLFFTRLRRRQKWVFLLLAVLFAVSFVALGVGSGAGGGLEQSIVTYLQNLFGTGNDPVGKAQGQINDFTKQLGTTPITMAKKEIRDGLRKGYQDLAKAYVTQNNVPAAILALNQYLALQKTDGAAWSQLAGYEATQADTYRREYYQVFQSSQLQSPGSSFAATGALQGLFPKSAIDDYYSQQTQPQLTSLSQQVSTGYNNAVQDYEKAAKYAKGSGIDEAAAQQTLATFAQRAGNTAVALKAWQRYVELKPNSPNLKQIEAICKQQLHGSCVPKNKSPKHSKK